MANGLIQISGYQTSLPTGSTAIGPYSIPPSAISEIAIIPFNSTNAATAIPAGSVGVILVANATSAMTASAGFISAQLTRINVLGYPSIWVWDSGAIPSNVYVTVSNTSGAAVSVQVF